MPRGRKKGVGVVPLQERFWRYATRGPAESCWEWRGSKNSKGYGVIAPSSVRGPLAKAHRVAWEMHNGPIPEGLCVLHRCDNPPCVNPAHLFLGTNDDNQADMRAKGRGVPPPRFAGESHPQAKITDAQAREIAVRRAAGERVVVLAAEYGLTDGRVYALTNKLYESGMVKP